MVVLTHSGPLLCLLIFVLLHTMSSKIGELICDHTAVHLAPIPTLHQSALLVLTSILCDSPTVILHAPVLILNISPPLTLPTLALKTSNHLNVTFLTAYLHLS